MLNRVLFIFAIFSLILNAGLFDFTKLYKAEKLYRDGDYNASAKMLNSFGVDGNKYRYDMANTYYKAGRYNEAIIFYKRAFGNGVDELNRIYNLGNCYFKLQDYDNAILAYKTALKIREDKDVEANLALAIKKLQEPKKVKQKSKKHKNKKKKKEKNGKSKKKNKKKLSKKELKKLKELAKKKLLQKELKKMLNSSLKERKVEVLMYRIKEGDIKNESLKPW